MGQTCDTLQRVSTPRIAYTSWYKEPISAEKLFFQHCPALLLTTQLLYTLSSLGYAFRLLGVLHASSTMFSQVCCMILCHAGYFECNPCLAE
eukprot:5549730-Amphidinium_carterae.1